MLSWRKIVYLNIKHPSRYIHIYIYRTKNLPISDEHEKYTKFRNGARNILILIPPTRGKTNCRAIKRPFIFILSISLPFPQPPSPIGLVSPR